MSPPDQHQHGDAGAARPRFRWTPQLHQRFVLAVSDLGGADKVTPRSVLRAMAVPGLTLHNLKSHLQSYRSYLAASPADNDEEHDGRSSSSESQPDEYDEDTVTEFHCAFAADDDGDAGTKEALCDSSRSAARMQREVQRKLQEQIEVQRHLQLRIEAQGRYLQSVLRRAQAVLADHSLGSPAGAEAAKVELASAAETGSLTSSSSSSSSPSPPRHRSANSCVTSSSSEAESMAAGGSKRLCTVEQAAPGKRTFLRSHHQQRRRQDDAEDGSSEIDLNM